jgi:methionyl-tRNA synthetase
VALDPERRLDLADTLSASLEALGLGALLGAPARPAAAARLWTQLGVQGALEAQRLPAAGSWGGLEPGTKTARGEALFPRLDEPAST